MFNMKSRPYFYFMCHKQIFRISVLWQIKIKLKFNTYGMNVRYVKFNYGTLRYLSLVIDCVSISFWSHTKAISRFRYQIFYRSVRI